MLVTRKSVRKYEGKKIEEKYCKFTKGEKEEGRREGREKGESTAGK